ncbi:hypothetical protein F5Y16DRAFT_75838 [Xylariaceae sp. FL0255]|nr:hypothetical protein F5Y16DRAFT_75838 [Xylariaceae sp. FL0255]
MDPLSIFGGLGTGIQLVSMGAQTLLAAIKLIKELKGAPQRLCQLLDDVDDSIQRLCQICNAGSHLYRMLDPVQLDPISRAATALYAVLQDIHKLVEPLKVDMAANKMPVRRVWNSIISLKLERELEEKLRRLDMMNIEVIRELGMVGLEVQASTNKLILSSNAQSAQSFSSIQDNMKELKNEFSHLTSSVEKLRIITQKNTLPTAVSSPEPSAGVGQTPSLERQAQLLRLLAGSTTSSSIVRTPSPNKNLDFILVSIRTYYTTGNYDSTSPIVPDKVWNDTSHALYLLKTHKGKQRGSSKSETRALQLLNVSTADAYTTLNINTASTVIELLSTLAPINTTVSPYVRDGLLLCLAQIAEMKLPARHPIALVIKALKDDKGDNNVTLRALSFITDRLQATLGPVHELTQMATKRLVALLRRSGEHQEALRVVKNGLALLGSGVANTMHRRKLSRQIEHIYIDQRDWAAALDVCLDIVGQQQLDSADPDPQYHDECAVYTMEDIAKIFECAGNADQHIAWLKQASISGGMLWGREVGLAHIQDKLSELLKETGREEESALWQDSLLLSVRYD